MNRRNAVTVAAAGLVTPLVPTQAQAQEPKTQFTAHVTVADVTEAATYLGQIGRGMEGLGKGGIIDAFSLTPSPAGLDLLVVYTIKDASTAT
jgi:hypothetical protein